MRLLLDTVVLIYSVESPELLSKRASAAIQNPQSVLELSTVSLSEIAIKTALGKLRFPVAVVRQAVEALGIRILPYTADHAFQLFDLAPHHRDPFDRKIIAQALVEAVPVVTPDQKFQLYSGLKVIW